jgi:ABC-type lipoprotein release transport system permease subunit
VVAFLEIARTGLAAILLHPLRSFVTVGLLVAVLLPFLTGLGLAKGLEDEADASVRFGADLYVTARQFGRNVPIPLSAADEIRKLPGVVEVVPRIVGGIVLGKNHENAVLVGMPSERFPAAIQAVEGRLHHGTKQNELVVGTELARRLKLKVGALLPPFYHSAEGERVSQVVGVFASDVGIWQANLIFTSFNTAAHIFDQKDRATDLLVYCRPGYQEQIAAEIHALPLRSADGMDPLRPHVVAREDAALLLRSGVAHRQGIFSLHFLLAFVVGILAILVNSGPGLAERRREIGILKATGWQTDEILLRSAVENFLLALAGISVSVIAAFVWLKWLNGYWIAGIFLTGVDAAPSFQVPFRLTPIPVLIAFLIGLTVVLSGTLYASWRAATVPPSEAMK